jgi:hypothetical protein
MEQLGNSFPKKGHMIIWDGYSFELMRVKSSEIKDVKIKSTNGDHLREPDKKDSNEAQDNDHQKAIGAK